MDHRRCGGMQRTADLQERIRTRTVWLTATDVRRVSRIVPLISGSVPGPGTTPTSSSPTSGCRPTTRSKGSRPPTTSDVCSRTSARARCLRPSPAPARGCAPRHRGHRGHHARVGQRTHATDPATRRGAAPVPDTGPRHRGVRHRPRRGRAHVPSAGVAVRLVQLGATAPGQLLRDCSSAPAFAPAHKSSAVPGRAGPASL